MHIVVCVYSSNAAMDSSRCVMDGQVIGVSGMPSYAMCGFIRVIVLVELERNLKTPANVAHIGL